ncbi:hypothetical protein MTO96_038173, partial [Rhipicephalus appendiculatus]
MRGLPKDEIQESDRRRVITLLFSWLLVLGLALLGSIYVLRLVLPTRSPDSDATMVDTLPSLHVPKTSASRVKRPSEESPLHRTSTSEPGQEHVVPPSRSGKNECTDPPCRLLAQQIRSKIDYNVDPCRDFYNYVCNTYRGTDPFET